MNKLVRTLVILLSLLSLLNLLAPLTYGHAPKTKKPQSVTLGDSFNDGWKVGWKAGWKQVNGQYSYPPYAPFPPFPEFGQNDFQGGYNAGFLAGIAAAGG
jgi:hypothetical protein